MISFCLHESPACWAGNMLLIGGMVGIRPQEGDLAGGDTNSQLQQVCTQLILSGKNPPWKYNLQDEMKKLTENKTFSRNYHVCTKCRYSWTSEPNCKLQIFRWTMVCRLILISYPISNIYSTKKQNLHNYQQQLVRRLKNFGQKII